jgi:hypothetical protein
MNDYFGKYRPRLLALVFVLTLVITILPSAQPVYAAGDCVTAKAQVSATREFTRWTAPTPLGCVPSSPADFSPTSLSISPQEVSPGETVYITFVVTNTAQTEGRYTATLKINGTVEGTKDVTVGGGAQGSVVFAVTRQNSGVYLVDVDGLKGSFTVAGPSLPPPSIAPSPSTEKSSRGGSLLIVAAIVAAACISTALALMLRNRRRR